jgi:hypothetical protein
MLPVSALIGPLDILGGGKPGDDGAPGPQGPAGAGIVGDSAVPYTTEWQRPQRWRKLAGTATAHSATASADALTLATTAAGTQMVGPSIPIQQLANRTVIVEAQFTSVPGAADGFFFGVGGLTYGTLDSAAAVVITWRANGSMVVNNASAATITPWAVSPSSAYNLPAHYIAQNDVLRMVWKFGADPSTATMTPFKNGVPTGQTFTVSGLTEGCLWAGGRLTALGQSLRILRFSVLDNARKGYFWVDSAASATGADGTEARPYPSFAGLQDFVNATGLRRIEIVARGAHRGRPPVFTGFDEVVIRASVGDDCTIYGSELVTDGWIATPGGAGVWHRTGWLFDGVLNQPNGGVIDPNRVDGVIPFTMYEVTPKDTAPEALAEGQTSVHNSGPNAQKLFIRPWGGTDPNSLPLELVNRTSCLIIANGPGAAKDCYTKILGVRLRFATSYPLALDRVRFRIVEIDSEGSLTTSGIGYLDASGETINTNVVGVYNDLYATVESSSGPVSRRPRLYFSGIRGRGAKVGDGLSIHNTCHAIGEGGELTDTGKYGVVVAALTAGADVTVRGMRCARNAAGNFANSGDPAAGLTQRLLLIDCHGHDAPINVLSNNSALSQTGPGGQVVTEVMGGGMLNAAVGAGYGHFKLANTNEADATRVTLKTYAVATGGTGADVVNNGGTHVSVSAAGAI